MSFSSNGTGMQKQKVKPGVTGKFGLGVQNEAGQRLTEFCQKNALVIANTLFKQHKRLLCTWTSSDGQDQIQVDGIFCHQRWKDAIQQQKQDQERTMAQIMNSLLQNSALIEESRENHQTTQVWPKSNPLQLYSRSDRFKGLDLIELLKNYTWRFMTLYRRQ